MRSYVVRRFGLLFPDRSFNAVCKDTLIKTASLSASRSCVKRPSGGCEGYAGRVIPHYVGPATLLRHFLPANPSQSLNFADLIRVSCVLTSGVARDPVLHVQPYKIQKMDVSGLRREYRGDSFDAVDNDPIALFGAWFEEAVQAAHAKSRDPNAMSLSTVDSRGRPSGRIVLLKGYDRQGFVFYTNYGSRKACDLEANPWASLTFWWDELDRQVRIEGRTERTDRAASEAYFASRPRGKPTGRSGFRAESPSCGPLNAVGRRGSGAEEVRRPGGSLSRGVGRVSSSASRAGVLARPSESPA